MGDPSADATLLVTGASGYLGRALTRRAVEQGFRVFSMCAAHPERVAAGTPVVCDLRDAPRAATLVSALAPRFVIHAAALNPGQPEAQMGPVNAAGSEALARAASRVGARLIHLSTDMVHDGDHAPYADDAAPSPVVPYGRSKAQAEGAVRAHCPGALIVRTSLIYGLDELDRATSAMAARLAHGERLSLFTDSLRQPIWNESLCQALLGLLERPVSGFLNLAGEEVVTRLGFATKMLARFRIPFAGRVEGVLTRSLVSDYPIDLRLRLERARALGVELPGLSRVLADHPMPDPRG